MPNGTYGGVRGWGREAPAYSIPLALPDLLVYSSPQITIYRTDCMPRKTLADSDGPDDWRLEKEIESEKLLQRCNADLVREASHINQLTVSFML
ncbi:MAG: hypothetical protein AABZ15_01515 [Nitrospirota bacterium]